MPTESISIDEAASDPAEAPARLLSGEHGGAVERLLVTLLGVQQSVHAASDHYARAADAVVRQIGLDQGLVMLRDSDGWRTVACCPASGDEVDQRCRSIIDQALADRRTYFETELDPPTHRYVVAPLVETSDNVVGVLIGARHAVGGRTACGVTRGEALLTTLVAGMVGFGLAREDRDAQVSRFQMQLEQFASAKLVKAMKDDPAILEPREREITVLFSDIRGFTGLSERVGAETSFRIIRNLMNQLTGSILDEDGFIMGYAGDGIAAMWNAPTDQSDHADLACWAAVNMQQVMAKLSQFWNFMTAEHLAARIGICTGLAHVGNAGSRWRLNYSAIGPCVNLASRLEGANKYFGTSILISESTRQRLLSRFSTRRIGPVVVSGAERPTNVHQVLGGEDAPQAPCYREYESALGLFEQQRYDDALRHLSDSIERSDSSDQAALELRSLIEKQISTGDTGTPVLRLPGK